MDPRIQILIERGLLKEQDIVALQPLPGESEVDAVLRLGIISEADFREAMASAWVALPSEQESPAGAADSTETTSAPSGALDELLGDEIDPEPSPAIQMVENLLHWGHDKGVSALCLEPREQSVYMRARSGGVWTACSELHIARSLLPSLTARLKILADLDICERRRPQRGVIRLTGKPERHIIVDFLPTLHREEIFLYYFAPRQSQDYAGLELPPALAADIERVMQDGHGLILACGPAHQGRIATLYAIAEHFVVPPRKLVTIEGSPYRRLAFASQVEVVPGSGFGYAFAIRSALQHLPDALLVGEIGDRESAEMVIQAAFDTNVLTRMMPDTPYHAIVRFLDMGIEPLLLARSLRLIFSQRRLRLLCPHCKQASGDSLYPYRAQGCTACLNTGFIGVKTLFSALAVDEEIEDAVRHLQQNETRLKETVRRRTIPLLRESALALARQGFTSHLEAVRCTPTPE